MQVMRQDIADCLNAINFLSSIIIKKKELFKVSGSFFRKGINIILYITDIRKVGKDLWEKMAHFSR